MPNATARLYVGIGTGAVRWLGFLPSDLGCPPSPALFYVAEQLGDDPRALAESRSQRTRRRRRSRAIALAGFRSPTAADLTVLEAWLASRAQEHDSPTYLLREAAGRLRERSLLRPSLAALERLVGTARAAAAREVAVRLDEHMTPGIRRDLDALLPVDLRHGTSALAWIRSEARSASPERIVEQIEKLEQLRLLGAERYDVTAIAPNRARQLAAIARHATNQSLERRDPLVRYPALYVFCADAVSRLTDEIVDLFDQALGHGHARARRELEQRKLADANAANEKVHLFAELVPVLIDPEVPDAEVRRRIFERVSRDRLAHAAEEARLLARPLDDNHYLDLERRYRWLRQFTPRLLETLELDAEDEEAGLIEAVEVLRELNRCGSRAVPKDAPRGFIPRRWQPYVLNPDGSVNRHHWELCLLSELRTALRAGRVWVRESRRYRPPDSYLIPAKRWGEIRTDAIAELDLPMRAEPRLDALRDQLDARCAALNRELERSEGSVRLVNGELTVSRLRGVAEPEDGGELAAQIASRLPLVDLSELLIEVDRWCGFSDELTHAGGARARSQARREQRYAAIVAHACNLGLARMAQAAGIPRHQLGWVTEWYLRPETLAAANARVVDFHHAQPLASAWGDGRFSSSDGKRYPVGVESAEARAVPRYFGRGRGVTFYSWTSDQHTHYASKVVRTTVRDATHVLDGILDNETELEVEKHTTDTAGYSDIVFALFDLLGLEFAPRLAGLADTRLYRLGSPPPGPTAGLLEHSIRTEAIAARWDDLLRVAASLRRGEVTASLLVSRLQAAGPRHPITLALREYGRIAKTAFILHYLADEEERRAIGRQLNKAEALHALHEAIFFGGEQRIRLHSLDRQSTQAHCLHLVANAIITWNTVYIQRALEQLSHAAGEPAAEELSRLTPTLYAHINPHGTYTFDASAVPAEGFRPLREPVAGLIAA